MKKTCVGVIAVCLLAVSGAYAQQAASTEGKGDKGIALKPSSKAVLPPGKSPKEMTVTEIAKAITEILDWNDEVIDAIPDIRKIKGATGAYEYAYKGVPLYSCRKEKLLLLLSRVNLERARIQSTRIQQQLESIQQAQRAMDAARQASKVPVVTAPPSPPPASPRVSAPPRIPAPPSQNRR